MTSARAATDGRHIRLPSTLAAAPRGGVALAAACALLVVLSCFPGWAGVRDRGQRTAARARRGRALLAASPLAVFDHTPIAGRSDGARVRKEERR